MAVVFSTRDVHPRERLAYWRETMSIVPHDFSSSVGSAFLGTVRSEMLDDVLVSEFECDHCEVTRTTRHISRSDCDDFLLCMQLTGRAVHTQDERQAVAEKGSFVLIDPRRPFSVSYIGHTRSISLKLPRQAFEARLGATAMMTARAVEVEKPLAGLAAGFLSLLPTRIEAFPSATKATLAEQTLDLLALAFSVDAGGSAAVLSSVRAAALMRLKATIEARLAEPTLKPGTVAAAAGMSVRYANDLLSEEGYSLERYIQARRLERCRQELDDPAQMHRKVGDIAFSWGFSDLSHFARRFRAAYGLAPKDFRQRALERASLGSSPGQGRPKQGPRQS
jgi:AraC family transcriptional regulator, positive regulator of tynA and feaB